MALFGVKSVTIGVLCLLSLASGQFQANNPRQPCADLQVQSGHSLFSDPNYCQNYTQCDTAGNWWTKNCGGNLLYDSASQVCVYPEQARCPAWPCDSTKVNIRYPGLCCDAFYTCNGAGYTAGTCSAGQFFNAGTGQCQQGACTYNPGCVRSGTSIVDPPGSYCYHEAIPNEPCSFKTTTGPGTSVTRLCPAGTAFNSTACQCSILNPNCPATNSATLNTQPDAACRKSFSVEFDSFNPITGSPRAYSDKLGTQPVELPDQAQSVGITYNNGRALFASNLLTGGQPYIYYPSFSNKQMMGNVVFKILFTLGQVLSSPFELISNNYNDACIPNLRLWGTHNGQTLNLNLLITGFTNIGISSQIINNVTLSLNINAALNEYISVVCNFVADGRAYFSAVNMGQNQMQTIQVANSTVSGNLGSILGYNTCGFVYGKGLRGGNIERIQIHENCIDVARA